MNSKRIAILGSTGSIGTQALKVIEEHPDLFTAEVLTANSNTALLARQARKFKPDAVVIADEGKYGELKEMLADEDVKVYAGQQAICDVVQLGNIDMVLVSVVGFAGLLPTISAIEAHKPIALANKETLVCAGHIIMPLIKEKKVPLLPVDSEHSAIFQSLQGQPKERLAKILLTASGGPFRGKKREELVNIRPEDALKHPNWSMGRKITIDSSTLVNKGLEVMEAHWLFDTPYDKIQVVVQPQSVIHSMVEYEDGGIMSQLGTADMKLPIQYALFYPDRRFLPGKRLDFYELSRITFEKPDTDTFRGLLLGYRAGETGGSMPTVYNAANEMAVSLFLDGKIGYLKITELIEECMEAHKLIVNPSVEEILQTEQWTYDYIKQKQ